MAKTAELKPLETALTYRVLTTVGSYVVSKETLDSVKDQHNADNPGPTITFETESPKGEVEVFYNAVIGYHTFDPAQ